MAAALVDFCRRYAAGQVHPVAWMNLLGDLIHNVLDGMLVAGAWLAGPELGLATTIAIGQVIVLEAGLSYLGYGIPRPTPTWGSIIRDGRETIDTNWWLAFFPGLALVGTALAVNTLADRLRVALNPRQLPAP